MKEKTLYTCEYCHTDYADKQTAIECEKVHVLDFEIFEKVYKPKSIERSGFPIKIVIKAKDGRTAQYERRG